VATRRTSTASTSSVPGGAGPTALPWPFVRSLATLALAGVAVRVGIVLATPGWSLTTDGWRFFDLARSAMKGTAFIPPLYPAFIRAVWWVTGEGIAPVRFAQCLAGGLTVALTGLLAARLAPDPARSVRAGKLAAAAAAFAPPLLFADVAVLSEGLTAFLLLAFLLLADRAESRESRWAGGAAGLVAGLAVLMRAPLLLWVLVRWAAAAASRGRAPGVRQRAALVAVAALATIAPWTARNAALFGRVIPVSSNGGYNFWKSFHPACEGTEDSRGIDYTVLEGMPEADLDGWGYRQGLRFIQRDPVRAVRLAILKQGYFWGFERLFAMGLRDGIWGRIPRPVGLAGVAAIGLTQLLWLFAAPAGLAAGRWGGLRRDTLLLVGWTALTHLVFIGEARYHAPLVPLLLAASAVTLVGGAGTGTVRGWNRRRLAGVTAALALPVLLFWGFEIALQCPEAASLIARPGGEVGSAASPQQASVPAR